MYKSRTVDEDGYYEIEFNSNGIFLTKMSREELNEIPISFWIYMRMGDYIEGENINNYFKKSTNNLLESTKTHKCIYIEYIGFNEKYRYCGICGEKEQ